MMDERELAIWKGIRDALCEPIESKRLWKPECMECNMYDHIEHTGCFLDRCRINKEPTWTD
jgi:hypothetical protein